MRVCIGQMGGVRNMEDPELTCSDWAQPNNAWQQLSVDGVAKNGAVYVMIWSTADIPVQHNDIYADDSCFEVLPSAGAAGICKGAGFVPTGPNVMPVGEDAAGIKNTTPVVTTPQKPVPANAAIKAPAGDSPALAINAKISLNLRQDPKQTAKVVGNAKRGAVLPVVGKSADGKWFQVSNNGANAWVLANLTLPNAAAKAVPVIP